MIDEPNLIEGFVRTMSLSRRKFFILASTVSLAALPLPAWAENAQAEALVQKIGQDVLRVAKGGRRGNKALQAKFAALLNSYINIPGIANFALGTARSSLPADKKSEFYALVSNYAAALFAWYVEDFQGETMEVTGSAEQGKFTVVDSRIDGAGEPLRWRISGQRVVDVNIKGVWLSISMKKMFEDTLRESGGDFEPLFAKLREAETW